MARLCNIGLLTGSRTLAQQSRGSTCGLTTGPTADVRIEETAAAGRAADRGRAASPPVDLARPKAADRLVVVGINGGAAEWSFSSAAIVDDADAARGRVIATNEADGPAH